jgi:hypothetical protein
MSKILLGVCAVEALNSQNLLSSKNRMQIQQNQVADFVGELYTIQEIFHELRITKPDGVDHPWCDNIEYYEGTEDAFFKDTQELTDFRVNTETWPTFSDIETPFQMQQNAFLAKSQETEIGKSIESAIYLLQEYVIKNEAVHAGEVTVVTGNVPDVPEQNDNDEEHAQKKEAAKKRLDCMREGMRAFEKAVVDELPGQSNSAKAFYKGLLKRIEDNLAWLPKL